MWPDGFESLNFHHYMKPKITQSVMHREFMQLTLIHNKLEWLAHLGQPMLYDGDLYVVRKSHNEMTPLEYYRWVKGIRVC